MPAECLGELINQLRNICVDDRRWEERFFSSLGHSLARECVDLFFSLPLDGESEYEVYDRFSDSVHWTTSEGRTRWERGDVYQFCVLAAIILHLNHLDRIEEGRTNPNRFRTHKISTTTDDGYRIRVRTRSHHEDIVVDLWSIYCPERGVDYRTYSFYSMEELFFSKRFEGIHDPGELMIAS